MSELKTEQLEIKGMTCAACVRRVEKALQRAPGVLEATVNLATERAEVAMEPDADTQALMDAVRKAGYDAQPYQPAERTQAQPLLLSAQKRLMFSAALTAPIFLLSMFFPNLLPGQAWWLFALTVPVQFGAALPFYRAAWGGVRSGSANMETLIVMGTLTAFFYSLWLTLNAHGAHTPHTYYETSAVIITLVLFGKFLEAKAKGQARSALQAIWELLPREVLRLEAGEFRNTPLEVVRAGDQLKVRSSDRVPVDAIVLEGHGWVNDSAITGEAVPRERGPGDRVLGGSLLMEGALIVEAAAVGEETVLAQVARAVEQAQTQKAGIQRLADRIASVFVPVVILIALSTFLIWWLRTGQVGEALIPAVSVLVIACPCALGLAVPIALLTGSTRASQQGILLKGVQALERAQSLNTLVLDKTGTLTMGLPQLTAIESLGVSEEELLRLAAAVEQNAAHPLADAIVEKARAMNLDIPHAIGFQLIPGGGAQAEVEGHPVLVGSARFLAEQGIEIDKSARSPVLVAVDGHLIGGFEFADQPLPEAKEAIRDLKQSGLHLILCSGDRPISVENLAKQLDIPEWRASALPQEKAALIAELQADGKRVGFVGDGVNDAPALTQADLGIAMGDGTHLAIESADIVLLNRDLRRLPDALRIAKRMNGVIRQNLFFAFIYNVIGIPLAAMGRLDPMIAAAAMSLSSVSVVLNALRLLRK